MESHSFAAAPALFAVLLATGLNNGMVQCVPARQPAHAASAATGADLAVDRAWLFAPTRQAVFFSRSRDRCAWQGGGPARG